MAAAAAINDLGNWLTSVSRRAVAETPLSPLPDVPGRPCPACSRPLAQAMIGQTICIDLCDGHGAWFDRGEAERVVVAVRNPGAARVKSGPQESGSSGWEGVAVGAEILGCFVEILGGLAS